MRAPSFLRLRLPVDDRDRHLFGDMQLRGPCDGAHADRCRSGSVVHTVGIPHLGPYLPGAGGTQGYRQIAIEWRGQIERPEGRISGDHVDPVDLRVHLDLEAEGITGGENGSFPRRDDPHSGVVCLGQALGHVRYRRPLTHGPAGSAHVLVDGLVVDGRGRLMSGHGTWPRPGRSNPGPRARRRTGRRASWLKGVPQAPPLARMPRMPSAGLQSSLSFVDEGYKKP